jgi:hypothetical protein
MSGNEWFLSSIAKPLPAINTLAMLYFTYSWRNVYRLFSQFSNCRVLILFRVAIHIRCSKYPPPESAHQGTRLIMYCRNFSKIPGAIANGLADMKMRGWSVSSYSVVSEYTGGVLSVHTDENLTRLRSGERGLRTSRTGCLHIYVGGLKSSRPRP